MLCAAWSDSVGSSFHLEGLVHHNNNPIRSQCDGTTSKPDDLQHVYNLHELLSCASCWRSSYYSFGNSNCCVVATISVIDNVNKKKRSS